LLSVLLQLINQNLRKGFSSAKGIKEGQKAKDREEEQGTVSNEPLL
jgi:hypothetical protein